MDEKKRYFTSPLGFTDGTDYIEFDNGTVTFVFTNGGRQVAHGLTLPNIENAVSRGIYTEYDSPPAGTIRSIIEKLEALAFHSGQIITGKKAVGVSIQAGQIFLSAATDANERGDEEEIRKNIGMVFAELIVLSRCAESDLISIARDHYQAVRERAQKATELIPVARFEPEDNG